MHRGARGYVFCAASLQIVDRLQTSSAWPPDTWVGWLLVSVASVIDS